MNRGLATTLAAACVFLATPSLAGAAGTLDLVALHRSVPAGSTQAIDSVFILPVARAFSLTGFDCVVTPPN